jgi:hypothetical protein
MGFFPEIYELLLFSCIGLFGINSLFLTWKSHLSGSILSRVTFVSSTWLKGYLEKMSASHLQFSDLQEVFFQNLTHFS